MEKFAMYGKLIAHPGKRDELAQAFCLRLRTC